MNTIEAVLIPALPARSSVAHRERPAHSQLWSLAHGQYVIELKSGQRLQSGRTYGDKIRRVLSNPF